MFAVRSDEQLETGTAWVLNDEDAGPLPMKDALTLHRFRAWDEDEFEYLLHLDTGRWRGRRRAGEAVSSRK